MFYFHKGEIEQYLAAKELMANSWRYYNKFSIWLKRNSQANIDPNNEYETGNYYCYGAELSMKERRQIKVYHRYLVQEIWVNRQRKRAKLWFHFNKFYLSILWFLHWIKWFLKMAQKHRLPKLKYAYKIEKNNLFDTKISFHNVIKSIDT